MNFRAFRVYVCTVVYICTVAYTCTVVYVCTVAHVFTLEFVFTVVYVCNIFMEKISYSVTQLLKYNLYTRLYECFEFAKFLLILLINMLG